MFNGIQIPTTQRIRQILDARTVSHPILLENPVKQQLSEGIGSIIPNQQRTCHWFFFRPQGICLKFKSTKYRPEVGKDVLQRWCLGKNTKVSWGMHTRNLPRCFFGGCSKFQTRLLFFWRTESWGGVRTGNPYPCFESPFMKTFTPWYFILEELTTMAQIYLRSVEPWLVFF